MALPSKYNAHAPTHCTLPWFPRAAGRLFVQLVDLLRFYLSFPIHDHTGDPLSEEDVNATHYEKVRRVAGGSVPQLLRVPIVGLRQVALVACVFQVPGVWRQPAPP